MTSEGIGLAIIGCGIVGRVRAELAREHPAVDWLGLVDNNLDSAERLGDDVEADLVTGDIDDLLVRPEVNAVVVSTDENEHVAPIPSIAIPS